MNKRSFLLALGAGLAVLPARFALAQNASIDRLNAYLNDLQTASARFVQENADGTQITGTFYLKKPGKMRFEYDAPSDNLVIADGRTLAVFDAKSNVIPQRYPQRRTPLSLLSMADIDVTSSVFVRRIDEHDGRFYVTMYDPEKPQNGQMVMVFDSAQIQLREWITTDRSGLETHVYLTDLQTGGNLANRLFNINVNKVAFEREHGG